jgi:hypothetical protein
MTRILIIDDDPAVCAAPMIVLEASGFGHTAPDGPSGHTHSAKAGRNRHFEMMKPSFFVRPAPTS